MALCDFCVTNVLRSTASSGTGEHQKSYAGLSQSAGEGCIFCKRLYDDVQLFRGDAAAVHHHDEAWPKWPLYRWSVRTLAKFRETSVCVRITFRPIAPVPEAKGGKDNSAGADPPKSLAQRTFCLFPEDGTIDSETDKDAVKTAADQVHRWMETCNSRDHGHESCHFDASPTSGVNNQPFLPTRLLDVSGDSLGPFRIVETKGSGIKGPYATLSHRWAEGMVAATTTTETKRAYFDEGVPWDELGHKFQQAVKMARFIGVQYIWIDSLCIIQDKIDFLTEGGLMHKVYRHSFCNIALECSEAGEMSTWTGEGGLLWQPYHRHRRGVEDKTSEARKVEDYEPVKYAADGSSPLFGDKTWRITPSDLWERDLLQANIYSRGWIFQERMLSPRILHLTRNQMFWDCPSMSASETLPKGLPQPLDTDARYDRHWRGRLQDPGNLGLDVGPNDNEPIQDFWQEAVKKYTRCVLTQRGDKLLAIWSVAKVVRDVLNSVPGVPWTQYCAGLWDRDLADQLAWRLADGPLTEATKNEQGFPSWSWASLDGPINVPDRLTDMEHFQAGSHADANVYVPLTMDVETPESADFAPQLRNPALKIQAHVGKAVFQPQSGDRKWALHIHGVQPDKLGAFPDVACPDHDSRPQVSDPFFVVTAAKRRPLSRKPFYTDVRGRLVPRDNPHLRERTRIGEEEQGRQEEQDMVYEGTGILMSRSQSTEGREYTFRRVGAFSFWEVHEHEWVALKNCYEKFRGQEYDAHWGLRFYLV